MELLNTLGINWQLLLVQLLNFVILIGVLSYFVYKPILKVIDARRERTAKAMEDARQIEQQRKEIEEFKVEQLRKMDLETGAFLEKAKTQAEQTKREILDSAQNEADQILVKAKEQLAEERKKLVSDVQGSVAEVVVRLSEKLLEREFSREDQARIQQSLEKTIPTLLR